MFVRKSEKYVVTSHHSCNVLTGARRVICKIEYFPRNVPPQNPSLERGGKKDIELSYNLPPMGRQEHTFGRSLTTLTTVVRTAVLLLNRSAYRSDGLHGSRYVMLMHWRFLAFYTPAPRLRLWIYYPLYRRLQLSHILLRPCPPHR